MDEFLDNPADRDRLMQVTKSEWRAFGWSMAIIGIIIGFTAGLIYK